MTAGESRYQVMPPLTPAELDELRRSIELHGVLQPIEVDENGEILDGHNRDMLARELGKDCPRRVVSGLGSDDNKRAYAMTVNIQRRQLTASKRKELHQKMRAEGWSVRRISAETGVPKSTVADDVAGVRSRTPEKVSTTRDGKTYKAKRTPKPKPKLREPTVPVSAGLKVVPEPEPERERDLPPMTVAPPTEQEPHRDAAKADLLEAVRIAGNSIQQTRALLESGPELAPDKDLATRWQLIADEAHDLSLKFTPTEGE